MFNDTIARLARKAESESNWIEAVKYWKLAGNKVDAEACQLILDATISGNEYRQRVLNECGEEPNKMEDAHAWVRWYDKMTIIYNEMFRK